MKFRQRHGPRNVLLSYNISDTRLYAKAKKPRTLLQRYKDEVFGAAKDPAVMKRAMLVDKYMKNAKNFQTVSEFSTNNRGFNSHSYDELASKMTVNRDNRLSIPHDTIRHFVQHKISEAERERAEKEKQDRIIELRRQEELRRSANPLPTNFPPDGQGVYSVRNDTATRKRMDLVSGTFRYQQTEEDLRQIRQERLDKKNKSRKAQKEKRTEELRKSKKEKQDKKTPPNVIPDNEDRKNPPNVIPDESQEDIQMKKAKDSDEKAPRDGVKSSKWVNRTSKINRTKDAQKLKRSMAIDNNRKTQQELVEQIKLKEKQLKYELEDGASLDDKKVKELKKQLGILKGIVNSKTGNSDDFKNQKFNMNHESHHYVDKMEKRIGMLDESFLSNPQYTPEVKYEKLTEYTHKLRVALKKSSDDMRKFMDINDAKRWSTIDPRFKEKIKKDSDADIIKFEELYNRMLDKYDEMNKLWKKMRKGRGTATK